VFNDNAVEVTPQLRRRADDLKRRIAPSYAGTAYLASLDFILVAMGRLKQQLCRAVYRGSSKSKGCMVLNFRERTA
jgi:hypothetical protein